MNKQTQSNCMLDKVAPLVFELYRHYRSRMSPGTRTTRLELPNDGSLSNGLCSGDRLVAGELEIQQFDNSPSKHLTPIGSIHPLEPSEQSKFLFISSFRTNCLKQSYEVKENNG